jgi:hypothetical protein
VQLFEIVVTTEIVSPVMIIAVIPGGTFRAIVPASSASIVVPASAFKATIP